MNNIKILKNTPIILNKKVKKIVVKPTLYIKESVGLNKHFTPAAHEWFNSIYSFNKAYIRTLPTANKTLVYLLKTFFYLELKKKLFQVKLKSTRYLRKSLDKVFIGKGNLKHTSSSIVITFFVYNVKRISLIYKLKEIHNNLFKPKSKLIVKTISDNIIKYNRPFTLKEYFNVPNNSYLTYIIDNTTKINTYLKYKILFFKYLNILVNKLDIINDKEKLLVLNNKLKLKNSEALYTNYNDYLEKRYWNYTRYWYKYLLLLKMNDIKFSNVFINKLNRLAVNIYNKNIEFNFVNLRKFSFNSDILIELLSLKLGKKKKPYRRIIKNFINKVKIIKTDKIFKVNKKRYLNLVLSNKIRNNYITNMFMDYAPNKVLYYNFTDSLNDLLKGIFPLKNSYTKKSPKVNSKNLTLHVLNKLKHNKLAGVRIEARGRLTKRLIAARSVFILKWMGGLKNVDSSFRGLPAILLRGHAKSNVQYTLVNGKTRNGAFGVKGWISAK